MIRPQPKKKREIDREYIKWIKGRACLISRYHKCVGPIDPHHVVPVSLGGSDYTAVPLCRKAHDLANNKREFQDAYPVLLDSEISILVMRYAAQNQPNPKRERAKRQTITVHIQNCKHCKGKHDLPESKVELTFKCPKENK